MATFMAFLVLQTTDSRWRTDHNDEVHLRNMLETDEEHGRKQKKNTSNSSAQNGRHNETAAQPEIVH